MFTTLGKNQIRNWLAGTTATSPSAIAVGTSSTTPSVDDTGCAEIFRNATTFGISPQIAQFEMLMDTIDATGNTITEMGLFNSTTGTSGTLFARNIFTSIIKTSSIEIQFEHRVEVV